MGVILISMLTALALAGACTATTTTTAPTEPAASWSFDGTTYRIVSGIAGDVPPVWLENGWSGDGMLVYLSDRDVTCEDFPLRDDDQFPPPLTPTGATITLKATEKGVDSTLEYAFFDIETEGASKGRGTDEVSFGVTSVEEGSPEIVRGWLDFHEEGPRLPRLDVSGTFEVQFCS
jgi:hypothetical protein